MSIIRYIPLFSDLSENINIKKYITKQIGSNFSKKQNDELQKATEGYFKSATDIFKEIFKDKILGKLSSSNQDNVRKFIIHMVLNKKTDFNKRQDMQSLIEMLSFYYDRKLKDLKFDQITFKDLKAYILPRLRKADRNEDIAEAGKNEITKIYEDSNWKVLTPDTMEAAIYWGKGTDWCTSKDPEKGYNNYFDQYGAGNLYISIDKKQKKPSSTFKYQFCFDTSEYKDADDESIDVGGFFNENPELLEITVFKEGLIKEAVDLESVIENHTEENRDYASSEFITSMVMGDGSYDYLSVGYDESFNDMILYMTMPAKEEKRMRQIFLATIKHNGIEIQVDETLNGLYYYVEDFYGIQNIVEASISAQEAGASSVAYTQIDKELKDFLHRQAVIFQNEEVVTNISNISIEELANKTYSYFVLNGSIQIYPGMGGWEGFDAEVFEDELNYLMDKIEAEMKDDGIKITW